jgi:hypothetical protein
MGSERLPRKSARQQRRERAAALRFQGLPFTEIGRCLGISKQAAWHLLTKKTGRALGNLPNLRPQRGRVQDSHRFVIGGACEAFAVGAEGHRSDPASVAFEGEGLMSGVGLPNPYRLVIRACGQALAVGVEGYTPVCCGGC